jgi:two-component sensor histidine kinase
VAREEARHHQNASKAAMKVRSAEPLRWLSWTRGLPVWALYGIATALVLVGLAGALTQAMHNYPALSFFPAVVLSGFFLGRGSGIYATVLSALLITYFLAPPRLALAIAHPEDFIGLMVFIAASTLAVALIDTLYGANVRLSASNQELRVSATQQATLLQELTHRVRNDLACLAALLSMQGRGAKEEEVQSSLANAAERIRVLGSIYQRLSADHGEVVADTRAFIADLCDGLRTTLVSLRPIALNVSVESHPVGIKEAVALGVIINELVTNAVKHAFADDQKGEIEVQFDREGDKFRLCVRDNGLGGTPLEDSTGLGLSLVRAVAAQLGGDLERRDAQPGSIYVVTIPAIQDIKS